MTRDQARRLHELLLAKAESTSFSQEAQTFREHAERLAEKHELSRPQGPEGETDLERQLREAMELPGGAWPRQGLNLSWLEMQGAFAESVVRRFNPVNVNGNMSRAMSTAATFGPDGVTITMRTTD